mmetsp:Transcript_44760/g.85589  ORF Transcript_44760/g.85589 Transcript_44760/m.85589 type:complete len:205 (+) Transcript_44760:2327-2941(+)
MAASRDSSTRSTPHTARLLSRTCPPPMRLLTSMRRGPREVYLASTWNTPILRPSARSVPTASFCSSFCCRLGMREGALSPVSLNHGSRVGQLSVTTQYAGWPPVITTSMSTSVPSRYSSSIIWHLRGWAPSGMLPSLPIWPIFPSLERYIPSIIPITSLYTFLRWFESFTRTTPMLSSPLMGFSTAGNPTCSAARSTWEGSLRR